VSVVDLKIDPKKPHRVLIVYNSNLGISSSVVVYSINKQKEIQKINFCSKAQIKSLGHSLAASFSPDSSKICVAFSNGRVLFFKSHKKKSDAKSSPYHTC
jgi:Tol biopolymer transport system component